ncbi:DUF2510 domain-containing protein [Nocardioides daejeonensis]|uniref:DUF2510 domain-containing protein n=1 Tax=Nocardioides daejeonensis TaxID=1046556 RepID=UPI0023B88193|nr:DUF2510 domain-containing protein [Nocardioides daejeonensis]
MSSPGWYPDPSGQPNSFRFWDGQAWSQQTTDNPYAPPPGGWPPVQPPAPPQQQGIDPGATQMAPQPPAQPEQPAQPGVWEQQPAAEQWGDQPAAQQWGEQQPEQPAQQWGATAGAGEQWQQAGAGQQQWGEQQTSQFAATPAAGGAGGWGGGDQWSGGGQQEWSPMPGDGGNGGSKKGLWIVLAGVLVILLIIGGIFGAMALTGDDKDDKKADDASTSEPTDEPTDQPTDDPTDQPTETDEPTDQPTETDEPDDVLPTAPVAGFCTSGDPTSRESYPEDGRLYGGGLSSPQIKGYGPPPFPVAEAYTFAEDLGTVYREVQKDKWMSVQALGAIEKEDAGSDLEAAAQAVIECMANSPDFYQNMSGTKELANEAVQVDGHDAWRVRWEIRVDDPSVKAGGDVAEVVVVDTGNDDDYGLYAGVAPLDDAKLVKRMDEVVQGLSVAPSP